MGKAVFLETYKAIPVTMSSIYKTNGDRPIILDQNIVLKNDHINFLDHIRGVAILIVFIYHCLAAAYGFDYFKWNGWFLNFDANRSVLAIFPATFGWIGVPIFFVVSGFCIHISHQKSSNKSISSFFARRFFRIYPAYFVAILIFSFCYPWHSIHFDSVSSFGQFFSHFFLIHNFDKRSFFGINSSLWSIAVEFQLYLLYPVLMLLVRRLTWSTTLWIIGGFEFGIRAFAGIYDTIYDTFPTGWITSGAPFYYWFSWSIGAAAAEAFLNRNSLPFSRVWGWTFPLLMVISTFIRPFAALAFLFAALSTVSVIGLLLKNRQDGSVGSSRLIPQHLRFVGIVSYSVYLLHQPILELVPRVISKLNTGSHLHPLITFALCSTTWVPILLLSWCFYRLFELPGIELGKTLIRRK